MANILGSILDSIQANIQGNILDSTLLHIRVNSLVSIQGNIRDTILGRVFLKVNSLKGLPILMDLLPSLEIYFSLKRQTR
jgi:hypothetical protein